MERHRCRTYSVNKCKSNSYAIAATTLWKKWRCCSWDTDTHLPAKVNMYFRPFKGHNSRTEKVVKLELEHGLPFIVYDFVHNISNDMLKGTLSYWTEIKCGTYSRMDGHGENLMSPMPCKQVNNVLNFHLSKIVDGFGPLLSVPCWGAIYGGAEGGGSW